MLAKVINLSELKSGDVFAVRSDKIQVGSDVNLFEVIDPRFANKYGGYDFRCRSLLTNTIVNFITPQLHEVLLVEEQP